MNKWRGEEGRREEKEKGVDDENESTIRKERRGNISKTVRIDKILKKIDK